jgi:hypothetical protein
VGEQNQTEGAKGRRFHQENARADKTEYEWTPSGKADSESIYKWTKRGIDCAGNENDSFKRVYRFAG